MWSDDFKHEVYNRRPLRNVQVIRRTSASFWFQAADRFAVALFETLSIDDGWDGKATMGIVMGLGGNWFSRFTFVLILLFRVNCLCCFLPTAL